MAPHRQSRRTTLKTLAVISGASLTGLGSLAAASHAQESGSGGSSPADPPPLAWDRHYTTSDGELEPYAPHEEYRAATRTVDGGYALGTDGRRVRDGTTSEQTFFAIVRADESGERQWIRFVDDGRQNTALLGRDIVQADDGGFVIAGGATKSQSDGPDPFGGAGRAAVVAKTDPDGAREWVNVYDPPVAGTVDEDPVFFDVVVATPDGGFLLGGVKQSLGWMLKLDTDGATEWEAQYAGDRDANDPDPAANWIHDAVQTDDGGYAIVLNGGQVLKTDASGDETWRTTVETVDSLASIVQTADGGYAVTGNEAPDGPGGSGDDNDFVLHKLDRTGATEWEREYDGPAGRLDKSHAVVTTSDGGYALAGSMERNADEAAPLTILKTDALGRERWRRHVASFDGMNGLSLLETADGGLAATHPGPSLAKLEPATPASTPRGETGSVDLGARDRDHWHGVSLERTYDDPVVIVKPVGFAGVHPVHVRLRNVSGSGFQFKLEEWLYLNGGHTPERVDYLVLESGRYQLDTGLTVDVGITRTNESWRRESFSTAFEEPPVLLTQPQTFNGPHPIVSRNRDLDAAGFEVAIQEEEAEGNHVYEFVGYVAMTPGTSAGDGDDVGTAAVATGVDSTWTGVDFPDAYDERPVFLADMQTTNGINTAGLRYRNLSADGASLFVEEERSRDEETWHLDESVGYLLFDGERTIDGT